MFGFGRDLAKVGVRAYADVLAADQSSMSVTIGNPNILGNTEIRWKLHLRVLPESEPPFEATIHALLPQLNRPSPGTRVVVLYDSKDHGRVELAQPASAADAAIDAINCARPDLAGAQVMGMPMSDMIRSAIADPNGFRAQMMQRGAEMQQQAMAAMQAAAQQAQPAQPAPADPVDRLERLAALKDRGLITDEEFEQQKRRILGEV
ncbi:SHOCT domain-containing protein [Mycobacterium sp. DL592]|uniref:SHOCT domain-containing protein n=1 Tax=Mycobacterium sp. DL592 TaxID=2675524 RepID=UPI001FBB3222|nr:SHOCT domain-containing protein [Mycobacterium sp. DL592]